VVTEGVHPLLEYLCCRTKNAKLQSYRFQFESLRMEESEDIATYFLRIDEVVNTMRGLGETIENGIIVQNVLRSLPARFDPKISALEERTDIANLLMDELQGILIAYEMRTSNENSSNKEVAFKVAKKAKKKVETKTSNHEDSEEDMEEANFVKNPKRGTGKYKGKLPLKCFHCGRIGNFASKCPLNKHYDGEEESNIKTKENKKMYKKPFRRNSYKKKSLFIKNNSESSDIDESDEISDIILFMAMKNQNDELIEEEEGEVDLEAELVSALSELKKVRRECKQFKREIDKLEFELQKSNGLIECTEIMLVDLKLKIEEARVTEEALTKMLAEKDKENEGLKIEVVSLRKKVQENNMNHSSQVLNQIICSKKSTYDKTGIGYKSAVADGCSSSIVEKAGIEDNHEKITSKKIESERQEENRASTVHRKSYGRHQNRFEGYCFFNYKYEHKSTFCNVFLRNISAHNNHGISRFEYERRHDKSI
jgi:hypothetical protein